MFAAVSLAVTLAVAGATPKEVVKRGNEEIQKTLAAPGVTTEQLAQKAEEFVDFGELAKRSLGSKWDTLTPAQQKDFSDTMKGLLRASYAQKAIGQGSAAQVTYGAETVTGSEATVKTTLKVKTDDFPVDYRLAKQGADWRVFDVITDEVSLVDTYAGQFRKLLADKGFDGLLSTLKAKRAQLEKSMTGTSTGSVDAGTSKATSPGKVKAGGKSSGSATKAPPAGKK